MCGKPECRGIDGFKKIARRQASRRVLYPDEGVSIRRRPGINRPGNNSKLILGRQHRLIEILVFRPGVLEEVPYAHFYFCPA
jgi:hypothetical protein